MTTSAPDTKDLRIESVRFDHFRNYPMFKLDDVGPLTVFVGRNAIGKTNIVEGIELLTALSSFRNPTARQLVQWGNENARLQAKFSSASRDLDLALSIADGKKSYTLNGKPKKIQTLKGLLPAVAFTPDDLDLVKGSQGSKRAALDALGSQLSPNYYVIRKDYEKILQHKNRLLKEEGSPSYLDAVDETLLAVGTQLYCYRSSLFVKLLREIERYYREITDGSESIQAAYVPSWEEHDPEKTETFVLGKEDALDAMRVSLNDGREEERRRRHAVIGPHADRIEFFIEGKNARIYGSQGQQRSIVLSFKLAEVALIRDMLDQKPVLLLDDVMSELDEQRRNALVGFISGDIQTFITTTNLQYFSEDILAQARVIRLGAEDERSIKR
ncbi:DNA replication/repair protein RecF [Raoultibacter timonensis]|uniref:DNA replication and repair protein RecF n=1 Tax=Raoultibacter timonensis TaxID=1907662 RepID=A0ABN6MJ04_9ACTN|nr:DNA replication and repair protein RecF [Raoultibacter timonensis]BDE97960.1 DNA replication and repair protein RecF [Raoultibacter timonensis]BDF52563.1 DNA replication and repair protein RecF [Raoultibacter timonensis]